MFLLVSGEGKGDIGIANEPGYMLRLIDKIFKEAAGYSALDYSSFEIVGKQKLDKVAKNSRIFLPGKKGKKGKALYRKNAAALAKLAIDKAAQEDVPVIAVLFRDSDGTNTTKRSDWQDKWDSMLTGFQSNKQRFNFGVPMIPKPKQEAWLICVCNNYESKDNKPYQHCDKLEDRSGNDASPNSLKSELEQCLSNKDLDEQDLINSLDINRLQMPSFVAFKDRLVGVIKRAL